MKFIILLTSLISLIFPIPCISGNTNSGKTLSAAGVCKKIAVLSNTDYLSKYVFNEVKNIKYNDQKIDLVFSTQGTAHVPYVEGFDSKTHAPLTEYQMPTMPTKMEELWGGDNLGAFVYKGHTHILHYKDFKHPVASISMKDGYQCNFSVSFKEVIGPKASQPKLCKQLMAGNLPPTKEFTGEPWMTRQEVSKIYGESSLIGVASVGLSNNSDLDMVGEIQLSSGAGAGCDETFFDIVDKNATTFLIGPKHDLLMKLQGADPSNRYPVLPCSNDPKFFVYKGITYFHTKPKRWPPSDSWNQYHRVTTIDNGKVKDVCDYKFTTNIDTDF